jgi:hypothetical protein
MHLLKTFLLTLSEASYHNMTVGRIPSVEGGIQPTIFDAKANLLTATANDTPAILAVGSNGQLLRADSTAATGLLWSDFGKVVTNQQTAAVTNGATANTYMASTGTDPAVTVTTGTKVLVIVQCRFTGANFNALGFAVSGATTLAAADARAALMQGGGYAWINGAFYLDSLTAGSNTFTMQYKSNVVSSGTYDWRQISVVLL